MPWIWAALVAAMLMAAPAGAMVIHCPDGQTFIEDSPEASSCAGDCATWVRFTDADGAAHARCEATPSELSEKQTIEGAAQSFTFGIVLLTFLGFVAYFIPTGLASSRGHPNTAAIFALNFLLGWTFIGWVVAFVWALTAVPTASDKAT